MMVDLDIFFYFFFYQNDHGQKLDANHITGLRSETYLSNIPPIEGVFIDFHFMYTEI